MDRVITAQMTALTPEKRQEYLNDIQRYFACQQFQVQMPMAYTVTCYQPWVRNLRVHAADMSTGRYYQVAWVTEQSPTHKK
jgi:hypothetical protein